MYNLSGQITICRRSDDKVVIDIQDNASRIRFLSCTMSLEEFAKALMGLGGRPIMFDLTGEEHVGKSHVHEHREVICPLQTYDRNALQKWLEDNWQEEGWILDAYLGSQSSVGYTKDNQRLLRYSVHKYV